MVIGPIAERWRALHNRELEERRSLLVPRTRGTAPTEDEDSEVAYHQIGETSVPRQQGTRQLPRLPPRSTDHERLLPRTSADARGVPPADDLVNASVDVELDPLVDASLPPSQLLPEVLRRLLESTDGQVIVLSIPGM
jgi:hypothetical protein